MNETIGIIAGEPPLPLLSLREARRRGWRTVVAAVQGAATPELAGEADETREHDGGGHDASPGEHASLLG